MNDNDDKIKIETEIESKTSLEKGKKKSVSKKKAVDVAAKNQPSQNQPSIAPELETLADVSPQGRKGQEQIPAVNQPQSQPKSAAEPSSPSASSASPNPNSSLSDISPSLKEGDLSSKVDLGSEPTKTNAKNNQGKQGLGEAGKNTAQKAEKEVATQTTKKARQAFLVAIKQLGSKAVTFAGSLAGWPVTLVAAVIIVVCLVVILIFGIFANLGCNGPAGKTFPHPAGKNDPHVLALLKATTIETKAGKHKLDLNERDKEYLASGQIDLRLAALLDYLVQKHEHIGISHIVSSYEDMNINPESGVFHDDQIIKNVSAHKEGLAADIDEIDFTKQQCSCGPYIPVKVSWQIIGENPYGAPVPDAISSIESASDLADEAVKEALKNAGVTGLDQPNLISKLKTISGISSPYDLTKPEVISALSSIGINGLDNSPLVSGLKRLQALKSIYDLKPTDISVLTSGQGADLMAQLGVNIDSSVKDSINKYQQIQVLQTIDSIDDLNSVQVQEALRSVGIDPNNANFRSTLEKVIEARDLLNGNYEVGSSAFNSALKDFKISAGSDFSKALEIYQAYKNGYLGNNSVIISEADFLQFLESSGVKIDSAGAQEILHTYQAISRIQNFDQAVSLATELGAWNELGLPTNVQSQAFIEKYQAAKYLYGFRGSFDDPQFSAALQTLGLNVSQIDTYRSQANFWQAAIKYTNIKQSYPDAYSKANDIQTLLNVHSIADLNSSSVQEALNNLGINTDNRYFEEIVQLNNSITMWQGITIDTLAKTAVTQAMTALGLDAAVQKNLGYINDLQTLANINNPFDLASPAALQSLKNLGVNLKDSQIAQITGKVGDINALININSPTDLMQPGTIKALGDLGVINVNSTTMTQIGAVQTLIQARSMSDLLNVNSILAMNSLGIIALSNPATAALTGVAIFSQITGIDLFGFGGCHGNTNCYKTTAQANVHKVMEEILSFPSTTTDKNFYKATQIITYSEERDILPFSSTINGLYGTDRPLNYGPFAMPEASDHIHVAY